MFVVNQADEVDGFEDAGVALLRTFNYVADEEDNYHAFQIVISVGCWKHKENINQLFFSSGAEIQSH